MCHLLKHKNEFKNDTADDQSSLIKLLPPIAFCQNKKGLGK